MRSKLLQKINKSKEVLDDQRENTDDSSEPFEATPNRTTQSIWLLMPKPLRKHSSQVGLTFDHDAEDLLIAPASPAVVRGIPARATHHPPGWPRSS